jgi:hypothetical protein
MNIRPLLVLAALAVSAFVSTTASAQVLGLGGSGPGPCQGEPGPGFNTIGGSEAEQRKCIYDLLLRVHGIGPGQARTLAGKQGEPWVRFMTAYEDNAELAGFGAELAAAEEAMRRSLQAAQLASATAQRPQRRPDLARSLAPSNVELQQMKEILDKFAVRLAAVRSELAGLERVLRETLEAARKAAVASASPPGPPAGSTAQIAGTWTWNQFTYSFGQSGNTFTWSNPGLHETATGKIDGLKVEVSWKGDWGAHSATGNVIVENGRAIRIHWSNGNVFLRK